MRENQPSPLPEEAIKYCILGQFKGSVSDTDPNGSRFFRRSDPGFKNPDSSDFCLNLLKKYR